LRPWYGMARSTIEYRVPYADTDQMGVVYYANYLVYFERVRNEMLRDIGFPYLEMEARGLMLPVIEAHCDYKQPARYDDLLHISGWFAEAKGARLLVRCAVHRGDELIASGHTVHACMRAGSRKLTRLPPELSADREDPSR
jgi:acyl-CoA thioester hydrolase